MQIEGDICTHIYPYRHASDIPPGGRAGLGQTAGGTSRAGFAPHGIRGAFNILEDQVAIVARLETFMCTDPPRRDSRLRFLVSPQDSRDALLPSRSSTTRQDASLRAVHHDPDLDLHIMTRYSLS